MIATSGSFPTERRRDSKVATLPLATINSLAPMACQESFSGVGAYSDRAAPSRRSVTIGCLPLFEHTAGPRQSSHLNVDPGLPGRDLLGMTRIPDIESTDSTLT